MTQALIKERQLTALMITHNMQQALTMGDRTLVLNEGHIVEDLSKKRRQQMQAADLMRYFV
jgi:putative ABC transport system ATP-binding protein